MKARAQGSYLLEFALVVLSVAFFIVGVSDLAKIFHARSAVHAGVSEGLRCLYPSDPTCAKVSLPSAELSGSRYNAWVWGTEGTLLPQSSFLVSTSLFNEPVRAAKRMTGTMSSIRVTRGSSAFDPHVVQFPISAHAPYLLTVKDLPKIAGVDPLRPIFLDRYTNREVEPNQALSIQGIRGSGQRTVPRGGQDEYHSIFEIGARSFNLSESWMNHESDAVTMAEIFRIFGREVPCYKGETYASGGMPHIKWNISSEPERCSHRAPLGDGSTTQRALLQGTSLQIPIMLRVSGVPLAMSRSAVGKVVVRLEWNNGRTSGSRELGGRVFTSGGSGNLIVRGADRSDIQKSAWGSYEERYAREIELHGTLPLLPLDSTVTVRLFLSSVSGDPVGWEGREIEVFHPRYQLVHETYSCGYSPNPDVCAATLLPVRELYRTVDTTREVVLKQEGVRECRRDPPSPLEQSSESVLQRISDSIRRGESQRGHRFWLHASGKVDVCEPESRTYECSDEQREYLKGCRPEPSKEYAVSHCKVDDYREELDRIVDVSFTEKEQVPSDRRGQCSDEPFPECAAPHVTDAGTRFLGAGGKNCSSAINVSPAPERSGPFYDNICESVPDKVRERYRAINKVPSDIPISVVSLPETPVYSALPPSDSCIVSEPTTGGDTRRVLCGRSVSRSAARRCCERHEGRCSLEELPPSPGNINTGLIRVIEEAAETRVIDTIQSIYPPARAPIGCNTGSENCIDVDARVVGNDSVARVHASVRVPLTLTSWFRSKGITLEYQEERILERALMNG